MQLQRPGKDQFCLRDVAILVPYGSMFEREQSRWGNRCFAARVSRVRLATRVPDLQKDARTFRVDGVNYAFPALDVGLRINAWCIDIGDAKGRDGSRICDEKPTFGGPLRIVVDH